MYYLSIAVWHACK
jgi:hypothetical protein